MDTDDVAIHTPGLRDVPIVIEMTGDRADVPGVLIFRALAGFVELPSTTGGRSRRPLVETADNASSAALNLFAMAVGSVIAKDAWPRLRIARVRPADAIRCLGSSPA